MNMVQSLFGVFLRVLLRGAAILVPGERREDWLQEWSSELWYVSRSSASEYESISVKRRAEILFCLGSFRDAWDLRQENKLVPVRTVRPSQSALRCTALLFLFAVISFAASFLLPNVRATIYPSSYRDSGHIVLISRRDVPAHELPSMKLREMRTWERRSQHIFSEFAFYQPVTKPILVASRYTPELKIARASANLFSLLGVEPKYAASGDETMPTLLVSEAVWRQQFHSDVQLLGTTVKVGIRKAKLGGVIARRQWRLPGAFDAWLLEPKSGEPIIPDSSSGFIVAHLLPSDGNAKLVGGQWKMYAPQSNGEVGLYECATLSSLDSLSTRIYVFMVLLALLALPATTSLPLGEYPVQRSHVPWSLRLRRWLFLGAKFGLLLPVIYFASLDFAYASRGSLVNAQYIQIVASFLIALFGFRWILKDQRKRCPVCLCKLTSPARVGEPSRSFLGWNGTELICSGGHGLLHVPELPTSWFGTQRWLYLDSSWSSVFLETV